MTKGKIKTSTILIVSALVLLLAFLAWFFLIRKKDANPAAGAPASETDKVGATQPTTNYYLSCKQLPVCTVSTKMQGVKCRQVGQTCEDPTTLKQLKMVGAI